MMTKSKTVRRNVILPFYIEKVDHLPVLDGYTWKELADGFYGDYRSLPCPNCGEEDWYRAAEGLDQQCSNDDEPYPTVERALQGISRKGLIALIKKLAVK